MFANFFCKLYLCNFCRICIFLLSYVCAEICLLGAVKASICRILHATARHPLMSALKPVDCYAPAIFTNTVAVQYKQHTKESKGNQETNVELWIFLQTFNIIFKPFVINGRCALPDAIKQIHSVIKKSESREKHEIGAKSEEGKKRI